MGTLKSLPPAVESAEELMAMAYAMEGEAARRYRGLAERMRLRPDARLARLFDFFADLETKHAAQIAERSIAVAGHRVDASRVRWEVPENFDEEAGSSRLLTPYRTLAIAVRNEERAFAFYSYVAAGSHDGQTREIAEELAKDEIGHAWLLRRERRKAYREEKSLPGRRPVAALPGSLAELRLMIAETEWRAAQHHRRLAAWLQPRDAKTAALFAETANDEEESALLASTGGGCELPPLTADSPPSIESGLRLLEESFERYMDIAARTGDEAVMRDAHLLAERAVQRLGLVHAARRNRSLA
jgi:rubrerythrin